MKKNSNNHGEMIVNYLATCGKSRVDTMDMMAALFPGLESKQEFDEALHRVSQVLQGLASGGMVRLSKETIPHRDFVPRSVEITPRMKKASAKFLQAGDEARQKDAPAGGKGEGPAGKKGRGKAPKAEAVAEHFQAFVELFEKKRKLAKLPPEWGSLAATLIYGIIEEETAFNACVKSFIIGIAIQSYQAGLVKPHAAAKEKEPPTLRPELLGQIEEIIRCSEEKNGELRAGRKARHVVKEEAAPLLRLPHCEISGFMRWLHNLDDDSQPGRTWRDAMSRFFAELNEHLPVYGACRESVAAGIIFQLHRKKLEAMD